MPDPISEERTLPHHSAGIKQVALFTVAILGCSLTLNVSANAFWPFSHKQKGAAEASRKKRQVAGVEVGLIPGEPAALYWKALGAPRAVLLCLHELGLHKGVFDDLGQRLSREQVSVYAIDLRGFGGWRESESADSQMNLDRTLSDIKESVKILHKLHPDTPVFVLGEAMGGALALKAAAEFPELIQGSISSAPTGDHYKTTSNYGRVTVRLISNGPNGQFESLGNDLIERATPKPELREAFRNDADVRLDITPKEMMACQFFMYTTKKLARNIKELPVLIVQGQKDGESKPAGSRSVYDSLATRDRQYLDVPDGDHYVFEDIHVDDNALKSTVGWINGHIAAKPLLPAS